MFDLVTNLFDFVLACDFTVDIKALNYATFATLAFYVGGNNQSL